MITEKLYYKDANISEFTALVTECEKCESGYKTVLTKTAFFPEGGGQLSDTGYIENVRVFDVREENGVIYHYTESPLKCGETVNCKLDFSRRFDFMQNHSGEHIVSGTVYKKYGFNNVSFRLTEEFMTVDFDGELSRLQLDEIENAANEAVYKNLDIVTFFPEKSALQNLSYRSKKELSGDVRLVDIKGVDLCACCAPHVKKTGEIGIIKLLDFERMRGGTRIVIKCGKRALNDYRVKYKNISEISALLSSKQEESAAAVNLLYKKLGEEKQKTGELKRKLIAEIIKSASGNTATFFFADFDTKELQLLADGLHKTHGGIKAVFSGNGTQYNFVICDSADTLDGTFKEFKARFNALGGGRNGMVSGKVTAKKQDIENFFGR